MAESRIALPLTGLYALVTCAAGGLFADRLWLQLGLLIVSSFLMMELNNSNALIRIYSRMVSCSFLVLSVMSHFLFTDVECGIVEACFVAFYLFLFGAYQNKRSVGRVFYAFVMLGVASTMFVQILYFVPVIWIMLYTNIMVGNLRSILASVLGLFVPYWFVITYCIYFDRLDFVGSHFLSLVQFGALDLWLSMPFSQLLTIVFVIVLSIVGMIHFRLNNYKDKIRTRMLFEFFSVMAIFTIIFMILQPHQLHYLLALLIVSTSPMIGHYIALTHTLFTNISFYVILFVSLVLTVCNIWLPF